MKRNEIYKANLDQRYGTEAGKIRPVLIVQTDFLNSTHSSVLICPLTTKVQSDSHLLRVHLKKGEADLTRDSDIMIDQVRAIDIRRIQSRIGKLSPTKVKEVEDKLKIVLGFED